MASGMEIHTKHRQMGSRRGWRLSWEPILVLGMVMLVAAGSSRGSADEQEAFVNLHRCEIAERLARIEATRTQGGKDRFIIVALEERGQSYVQCLFDENSTSLLCEASSGFYGPAEGEAGHLALSPSEIAGLGSLGFDTGVSDGNFQRLLVLSDGTDFDVIASLLLKALYDGYGARARSRLEIYAPLARRPAAAPCTLVGWVALEMASATRLALRARGRRRGVQPTTLGCSVGLRRTVRPRCPAAAWLRRPARRG